MLISASSLRQGSLVSFAWEPVGPKFVTVEGTAPMQTIRFFKVEQGGTITPSSEHNTMRFSFTISCTVLFFPIRNVGEEVVQHGVVVTPGTIHCFGLFTVSREQVLIANLFLLSFVSVKVSWNSATLSICAS